MVGRIAIMETNVVLGVELSRVVVKEYKLRLRYKLECTVEHEYPTRYVIGEEIVEPELISEEPLRNTHRTVVQGGIAIINGRISKKTLFSETLLFDLNVEPLPIATEGKTISWDIAERNINSYVEANDSFFERRTTYYEVVRHGDIVKSSSYGSCSNISIRIFVVDLGWTKIMKFSILYVALWMWIVIGFYQGTLVAAIASSVIVLSISVARMIDENKLQESVFFSLSMALTILCELAGSSPFFLWIPLATFAIIAGAVIFHFKRFTRDKAKGKATPVRVLSGHYPPV